MAVGHRRLADVRPLPASRQLRAHTHATLENAGSGIHPGARSAVIVGTTLAVPRVSRFGLIKSGPLRIGHRQQPAGDPGDYATDLKKEQKGVLPISQVNNGSMIVHWNRRSLSSLSGAR
jgi:hypothetical protein